VEPLSFFAWRFYYFFRDPPRRPPRGPFVLAPADGRVLYVTPVHGARVPSPVKDGEPVPLDEWAGDVALETEGTLVGIYMTPLSVHFNRAPVGGVVTRVVARSARGRNLSMARAFVRLMWRMQPYERGSRYLTRNARTTTVIEGPIRVAVVQIADRHVDHVDSFVREGQRVEAGDKIGMIRMGSQCDVFVPASARVRFECKPGDWVSAGETVLGEIDGHSR
jgi:phosphatidylserine decarboxylase